MKKIDYESILGIVLVMFIIGSFISALLISIQEADICRDVCNNNDMIFENRESNIRASEGSIWFRKVQMCGCESYNETTHKFDEKWFEVN